MRQIVAQRLIETGDLEGAIKAYREAIKIEPQLPGLRFELAEALLKRRSNTAANLKEAQSLLEEALHEDPSDSESECLLGEVYARCSDLKLALRHFSRALALQPNNVDAHMGLGTIHASSGQLQNALAELTKAVSLDPTNAKAHYSLALVYRRLGRMSDADRETNLFNDLNSSHDRLGGIFAQTRTRGRYTVKTAQAHH